MSPPQDLYPRLLGESWAELPDIVRSAHLIGPEKRGHFRVTHGSNPIARTLARWSRLPRQADKADVILSIHLHDDGERWERSFGTEAFTTHQWASTCFLVEKFHNWELHFTLTVSDGALVYQQRGARLCLGPMRLPVPLAFAPRVYAREQASGPDQVHIHVSVSLPCLGPLITYDGHLLVGNLTP